MAGLHAKFRFFLCYSFLQLKYRRVTFLELLYILHRQKEKKKRKKKFTIAFCPLGYDHV